jgi:hypothetical protein
MTLSCTGCLHTGSTEMDSDTLRGATLQDPNPLYEAFFEEDDEHGNPVFLFSSFGYFTQDFFAYFGMSSL